MDGCMARWPYAVTARFTLFARPGRMAAKERSVAELVGNACRASECLPRRSRPHAVVMPLSLVIADPSGGPLDLKAPLHHATSDW